MSFVWGSADSEYLRRRHAAMQSCPLFKEMECSNDPSVVAVWAPLRTRNRKVGKPIAATRMEFGADVNFGELTRMLFAHLASL